MSEIVIDIVANYLRKNGFDGLVSSCGECGCELNDLASCDSAEILACRPGYKKPCSCGENCDWHIATEK